MENLVLDICKKSKGFDYGHDENSVKKYEKLLNEISEYFKGNQLKQKYQKILGIRVSNSGKNIWLMIWHNNRINYHTIYTTQNNHLTKFGIAPRNTSLDRFLIN